MFLHGFRAKGGYGTGIMEATLRQQLATYKQVPLYGIFWISSRHSTPWTGVGALRF